MLRAAVAFMVRRNVAALNHGDYMPLLNMFTEEATLSFPGNNTWSTMYQPAPSQTTRVHPSSRIGAEPLVTHRGRPQIAEFLRQFVSCKVHMVVDDVLVNGPPWNMRIAVRVHHWVPGQNPGDPDLYYNRAVLWATSRWGQIVAQEDYEDTEKVTAFDRLRKAARDAGLPGPRI
ncbi:hypothetical protein HDU93_007180 [Gonapodya sp. JEL0774]|nr:hypothetical protein HDU93_007180 [Gonapodya sp. JEL0774]